MSSSIANAYPQNLSIDATDTNNKYKFTFYGNATVGAEFRTYDSTTGDRLTTIYGDFIASNVSENRDVYYNGEEIDVTISSGYLINNRSYVWRARIFDKIDLSNGYYPTTQTVSGKIKSNPYLYMGVTGNPVTTPIDEYKITLENNLNLNLPKYLWINSEKRKITAYNRYNGVATISAKFSTYPSSGTTYYITKNQENEPVTLESNQTCITSGIEFSDFVCVSFNTHTNVYNYYLLINNNYYAITAYEKDTGVVTLSTTVSIEAGTEYVVCQDFNDTAFFYFTTEAKPVIAFNTPVVSEEVLSFTANLSTNTYVKYYHWKIYERRTVDGTNVDTLVDESANIYNGLIQYFFRGALTNKTYVGVLDLVTQSDFFISDNIVFTVPNSSDGYITNVKTMLDLEKNAIKISWDSTYNGKYKILREIKDSNVIEYISTIETSSQHYFYDYKCRNNLEYKYYIVYFDTNVAMKNAVSSNYIKINYDTYTIMDLIEQPYSRNKISGEVNIRIDYDYMYRNKEYKVNNIFRPEFNISTNLDVKQNLGRETFIGYSEKASVGIWQTNYDSFSLSFMLGNTETINVLNDNQEIINSYLSVVDTGITEELRWKQMISENRPVLIKDYRGNIWFGVITSNTISVDNMSINKNVTINMDFTETFDINRIKIVG